MSKEQNTVKTSEENEAPLAAKPKKKRKFSVLFLLNGEFLQKDYFLKNLPFFLFIACMLAIYIANAYYAENKIREITQAENEIKELHAEYISLQAELTEKCKEYQVSKMLIPTGMQISDSIPPRVITSTKTDYEKIY
jgi:cell division protein FtsL